MQSGKFIGHTLQDRSFTVFVHDRALVTSSIFAFKTSDLLSAPCKTEVQIRFSTFIICHLVFFQEPRRFWLLSHQGALLPDKEIFATPQPPKISVYELKQS